MFVGTAPFATYRCGYGLLYFDDLEQLLRPSPGWFGSIVGGLAPRAKGSEPPRQHQDNNKTTNRARQNAEFQMLRDTKC